jgi:protocatechuate 3,4-dioxygenase beta subunit
MRTSVAVVFLSAVLLVPRVAYTQDAAITGVVTDASAAVLPGVTVEAASQVLTEKVRSVVTDGSGQYRIVALPPGTYVLTYVLPGFGMW